MGPDQIVQASSVLDVALSGAGSFAGLVTGGVDDMRYRGPSRASLAGLVVLSELLVGWCCSGNQACVLSGERSLNA